MYLELAFVSNAINFVAQDVSDLKMMTYKKLLDKLSIILHKRQQKRENDVFVIGSLKRYTIQEITLTMCLKINLKVKIGHNNC